MSRNGSDVEEIEKEGGEEEVAKLCGLRPARDGPTSSSRQPSACNPVTPARKVYSAQQSDATAGGQHHEEDDLAPRSALYELEFEDPTIERPASSAAVCGKPKRKTWEVRYYMYHVVFRLFLTWKHYRISSR
jgi:hypothetical protein